VRGYLRNTFLTRKCFFAGFGKKMPCRQKTSDSGAKARDACPAQTRHQNPSVYI
jgi:hypothetical protein